MGVDAGAGAAMRDDLPLARRVPREFFARSLGHSLAGIFRIWSLVLLAWWLAGAASHPVVIVIAIVLVGTMQYHLNVLGHDGLHYLLADNRRINDALCRWCLHGPHGAPLGSMRRNHLNHHVHFGAASDLDRQYYDTTRFASDGAFTRWLLGSVLGGMTWPIVAKLLGLNDRGAGIAGPAAATPPMVPPGAWLLDWASVLLCQACIALAAALLTGWWWAYGPLWLLPLFTVMIGLNATRSCLEHAEPGSAAPALHSFTSHAVERFFLSPFHMNVHAEHHLLPAVPWHRLPALRAFLQAQGLYGGVQLHASYLARQRAVAAAIAKRSSAA